MAGLNNIKQIASKKKKAIIYFHIDLDGVVTAIAMREYLAKYGIETIGAEPIQYGKLEYSIPMPNEDDDILCVLVDFAHGKPIFEIHTDHHLSQSGVNQEASNHFRSSPSNAETINGFVSHNMIFNDHDAKMTSVIDSADFYRNDIKAHQTRNVIFKPSKYRNYKENHKTFSLALNKIILSYRNKPGFLQNLVLNCTPSFINIYQKATYWIKKSGHGSLQEAQTNAELYALRMSEFKNIEIYDNVLIQYGGGYMSKIGSYNRYVPYENFPEIDYLIMIWPMGLVQVSKNPFKKLHEDLDLNQFKNEILEIYKEDLRKMSVDVYYLKKFFDREKEQKEDSVGFTFEDLKAFYGDKVYNRFTKRIVDLDGYIGASIKKKLKVNTKVSSMSAEDKYFLKSFCVDVYDVINTHSGGHRNITNMGPFAILNPNGDILQSLYGRRNMKSFMEIIADEFKMKIKKENPNENLRSSIIRQKGRHLIQN